MSRPNYQRRSPEWIAGLFEGEGTILIRKRPEDRIAVSLSSTDEDVIDLLQKSVKVGKTYGPYKYGTNKKYFWKWNADGPNACVVLKLILPFLCTRRRVRAEEALTRWEARQTRSRYTVSRKGMGGRPTHKTIQ